MQSSSPDFSCSGFDNAHQSQVIKGTYVCAKGQSNPGTAGSTPTSGNSPSKTGAAGHFEVNQPVVVGGSSLIVGLLSLFL